MLAEVYLVDLYCVKKGVASNLSVKNIMLHFICVIIIDSYTAFIAHDTLFFIEVHVNIWV